MVAVAPMTLISPVNVTINEGADAIFTCHVTGRPRPRILWFYQQPPIILPPLVMPTPLSETTGDYFIDENIDGEREIESTLTISSTLPSDTGFYVCFAQNEVAEGIVMESAFLSVQGQSE